MRLHGFAGFSGTTLATAAGACGTVCCSLAMPTLSWRLRNTQRNGRGIRNSSDQTERAILGGQLVGGLSIAGMHLGRLLANDPVTTSVSSQRRPPGLTRGTSHYWRCAGNYHCPHRTSRNSCRRCHTQYVWIRTAAYTVDRCLDSPDLDTLGRSNAGSVRYRSMTARPSLRKPGPLRK